MFIFFVLYNKAKTKNIMSIFNIFNKISEKTDKKYAIVTPVFHMVCYKRELKSKILHKNYQLFIQNRAGNIGIKWIHRGIY